MPSYGERKTFHQDVARVLEEFLPPFAAFAAFFRGRNSRNGPVGVLAAPVASPPRPNVLEWGQQKWNGWKDMNNWTDHEKRWKRCLNLLENASVNWLKQVHAKYATTRTWLSRTRSEPKSLELMETFAWTNTFKHVLLPQLETGDV